MITHQSLSLATVLTKWENFLNWTLTIEANYQQNKFTRTTTMLRTTRDPDAMDIDAMHKPENLSKEQEDWLTKKLCFQCSKHPFKAGIRCCNPVYKGYYELPETGKDKKSPLTTRV